jgi:5'-nucleotidase
MGKPLFLVTNDDGVHAPGIKALADVARKFGDVVVVAPHIERSACSQAISISLPLRLECIGEGVYAVEGTPADCVMLAVSKILGVKPDWVLSGINRGANLGYDTLYSGTVGAALESAIKGIPALAVSCHGPNGSPLFYDTAAHVVETILQFRDELMPAPQGVLNLNVPSIQIDELKGIKVSSLGQRIWDEEFIESTDPRGRPYFWVGGASMGYVNIPGSDCVSVEQRYASLSFLRPSLLCPEGNEELRRRTNAIWNS